MLGCFNLHGLAAAALSGAAPIQRAVWSGMPRTGGDGDAWRRGLRYRPGVALMGRKSVTGLEEQREVGPQLPVMTLSA